MFTLLRYLKIFSHTEDGANMVEYALIAALISVAAITVIPGVGTAITNIFTSITGSLNTGTP
jgi:pilus assembly protein Flp/PilA